MRKLNTVAVFFLFSAFVYGQSCEITHALLIHDLSNLRNRGNEAIISFLGTDVGFDDIDIELPISGASIRAAMLVKCQIPPTSPDQAFVSIFSHPPGALSSRPLLWNFPLATNYDSVCFKFYFAPDLELTGSLPKTAKFNTVVTETIIPLDPVLEDTTTHAFNLVSENISQTNENLKELKELFPEGTKVDSIPAQEALDSNAQGSYWSPFPNIDLDSSKHKANSQEFPGYAGDFNGCTAAGLSNSLEWLKYIPQIKDSLEAAFGTDSLAQRRMMVELSEMLHRKPGKGAWLDTMIMAKLEFIDKYKLPLSVEFQSVRINKSEINSPDDRFGHKAKNVSNNVAGQPNAKISLPWVKEQIAKGCDVEMHYYCFQTDSLSKEFVCDTTAGELKTTVQHIVTLNGIWMQGNRWGISWVDDADQDKKTPDSLLNADTYAQLFTEPLTAHMALRGLHGFETGYPNERCYIMQVETECYDSSVTFTEVPQEEQDDDDCDRVPDDEDLCPGGDDTRDGNNDGRRDCKHHPGLEHLPEHWICGPHLLANELGLFSQLVKVCIPNLFQPSRRRSFCLPSFFAERVLRIDNVYLGECGESVCTEELVSNFVEELSEWNSDIFEMIYPPKDDFMVYPNPANDHINMVISDDFSGAELWVRDALGRLVVKGQVTRNPYRIDIAGLARGTYFISLVSPVLKKETKVFIKN